MTEKTALERQIRSKELHIQKLEAQIREARGYIASLRRRLGDSKNSKVVAAVNAVTRRAG